MKNFPINKKFLFSLLIALLLLILNPTNQDFLGFLPTSKINIEKNHNGYYICSDEGNGREFNFVIFSFYNVQFDCYTKDRWNANEQPPIEHRRIRYFGVLKNFFKINEID